MPEEEGKTTLFEVKRKPGSGPKTGIGLLFEKRSWEPYFRITGTPDDGTAKAAGLQENDFLLEVDGDDITDMPAKDVTARILGTPGTMVRLKTMRPTKEYPQPEENQEELHMPLAQGVDNTAHALRDKARAAGDGDLPIPDSAEETEKVQTKLLGGGAGPSLTVPKDNIVRERDAVADDVQGFQGDNKRDSQQADTPDTEESPFNLKPLANLFGADDIEINPLDPFAPQVRKSRAGSTDDDDDGPDPMDTDMANCTIM